MKHSSMILIAVGIVLQIIGLFVLIELEPYWMMFYLLPIPLLLIGYYLGLQGKGYRPLRMPVFYSLALAVIVPYVGSVAIARKLFFTPLHGEISDKKSWQVSLWAIGMFVSMLFAVALLGLPPTLSYKMKGIVLQHIDRAREGVVRARQLQKDGQSFAGMLSAVQREIDAAKDFAERSSALSAYMRGQIECLSGELHLLKHEWDEAERSYTNALSTSVNDQEDVVAQAQKGLTEVKAARKKYNQ